jgi:hypothetical protein
MIQMKTTIRYVVTVMLSMQLCACSYHEVEDGEKDQSRQDEPSRPGSSVGPGPAMQQPLSVDPCAGQSSDVDDNIVRYTVKRNSKLDRRVYEHGERLSGRFYVSSYVVRQGQCEDTDSSHRLYKDDIKGVWLELSQMRPYDPTFIKTYFVPEEATSFVDDSHELGIIINPDFLVIDNQFRKDSDYLIRIQIENKTGVVNSSGTWHNDIEAFNVVGFTVLDPETIGLVGE